MKKVLLALALVAIGCVEEHIVANDDVDDMVTQIGPERDGYVPLGDADIWIVPPLPSTNDTAPEAIVWTLLHPSTPATATIRRTCTTTPEPFLWLSDPPNWHNSGALATLHECGDSGDIHSTVTLTYDGTQWIGVSATGAATLLPPE